jgi:hypothetical protein
MTLTHSSSNNLHEMATTSSSQALCRVLLQLRLTHHTGLMLSRTTNAVMASCKQGHVNAGRGCSHSTHASMGRIRLHQPIASLSYTSRPLTCLAGSQTLAT